MEILKIKIRVAQNVGKIWISREKILLAPFGAISGKFLHGPEKYKTNEYFLPIFLGGPLAAIQPVWAWGPWPMLSMHELSLSMPEPTLSLSMLILATYPETALVLMIQTPRQN